MRELGIDETQVMGVQKQQHSNISFKGRHILECNAYHWETYAYFKRHFHGGRKDTQSTAAFAQLCSVLILNVNVVMKQEITKRQEI